MPEAPSLLLLLSVVTPLEMRRAVLSLPLRRLSLAHIQSRTRSVLERNSLISIKACAFAANRSVSPVARPDAFQFVNVARLIACALLARGLEYVRVLRRTGSSFLFLGSIQRVARKSRSVERGDAR